MNNETTLLSTAGKIRDLVQTHKIDDPISCSDISKEIGIDYRTCFQVLRKMKNLRRLQIVKKTKADNDLIVYGYYVD